MAVGILHLELRLLSPHSLKEKRAILSPMKNYLRKKNVSVAEVDHHDIWQSAAIDIAMVGNDRASLQSQLAPISNMLEQRFPVQIYKESLEIL